MKDRHGVSEHKDKKLRYRKQESTTVFEKAENN